MIYPRFVQIMPQDCEKTLWRNEPDAEKTGSVFSMALTDPNDVCKIAYDGNLPLLEMKIRGNKDLATKKDEVCFVHLLASVFYLVIWNLIDADQKCIVMFLKLKKVNELNKNTWMQLNFTAYIEQLSNYLHIWKILQTISTVLPHREKGGGYTCPPQCTYYSN